MDVLYIVCFGTLCGVVIAVLMRLSKPQRQNETIEEIFNDIIMNFFGANDNEKEFMFTALKFIMAMVIIVMVMQMLAK